MDKSLRSPVVRSSSNDEEMDRVMANAAASFKYLWRELTWEYRRIIPALGLSVIKAAFSDAGDESNAVEHMWLSEIDFDGQLVRGTLLNSPNEVTSVKEGDLITLATDAIEDWMYVLSGQAYGGFTIQLLRARMSAAERRDHDAAWGCQFPDPAQVNLVPNWKQPGPGSSGDPDAEHPMSENMAKDLISAVQNDREAFFTLGSDGLNTLHSLALGGSAACVSALLAAGADPRVKTASGMTALDLAEMMGWPRVVELLRNAR